MFLSVVYMAAVILFNTAKSAGGKVAAEKLNGGAERSAYNLFLSVGCCVISVPFMFIGGGSIAQDFTVQAVLFGCVGGVCLFICSISLLSASAVGSLVSVNVFTQMGILVPIVWSALFLNEELTVWAVVGVVTVIAGTLLMLGADRQNKSAFSAYFVVMLVVTLVMNGGVMLAQKYFAVYEPEGNVAVFNLFMFAACSLLFLVQGLIVGRGRIAVRASLAAWWPLVLSIVCTFGGSQLMTILAGRLPTYILYPTVVGAGFALSLLFGRFFFREPVRLFNILSVCCMIAGLVLLYIT